MDEEVDNRIENQLIKLEDRMNEVWESGILAKNENQRILEMSENVELQIDKSNKVCSHQQFLIFNLQFII